MQRDIVAGNFCLILSPSIFGGAARAVEKKKCSEEEFDKRFLSRDCPKRVPAMNTNVDDEKELHKKFLIPLLWNLMFYFDVHVIWVIEFGSGLDRIGVLPLLRRVCLLLITVFFPLCMIQSCAGRNFCFLVVDKLTRSMLPNSLSGSLCEDHASSQSFSFQL